jgi:hypothetical protein
MLLDRSNKTKELIGKSTKSNKNKIEE